MVIAIGEPFKLHMPPLTRDEISKKLGQKIRQLRLDKGLTIEKLANESDIDYTQLSRIERGKINTSIYYVYRISHTLSVPIQYFFDGLEP